MVEVDEIAHTLSQLTPFRGELHHVFATFAVVVFRRNIFLTLLVIYICFCDAQFFFHTQLDRQSMSIPSGFAFHLESLHGLVAVEGIFDRTSEHMVNAGMAVSRRRSFEEYKLRTTLALVN